MGEMRKLDVTLNEELIIDIDKAIRTGDYSDRDDVFNEAIELWRKRRQAEIERLRALIQEGLDSGEPIEGNFDLQDIKRRGTQRLKQAGHL